jgi:hypothetical protein
MMETPDRFVRVFNEWMAYRIAPAPATIS